MAKRGHPEDFNDAQNRALRTALRELKKSRSCSQSELGGLLGISQQTVGVHLNQNDTGFSYGVATRIARECGYASVDTFFRAHKVALPSSPPPRTGTDG